MILQSLVDCYEALAQKGKTSRPGWEMVKVSYALEIDENGQLLAVLPLKVPDESGKKMISRKFELPARTIRANNINPNFLCDNAAYILGIDSKGKPERAKQCFESAKALHLSLLSEIDEPAAKAISRFFEGWNTQVPLEQCLFADSLDDLNKGGNLVFMYSGKFPHEIKSIAMSWQNNYDLFESGERMRCLVTGKHTVPMKTHTLIKGVNGAQSSGAALVSFNAPAFCSFNREQNINSPVGKNAAFAYTTALNHLLSDKKHVKHFGDTTLVYWAEDAEPIYQVAFSKFLDGGDDEEDFISNEDLESFMDAMVRGKPANWDGIPLKPDNCFYVLGLAPNAARLSVRFFLREDFGNIVGHLKGHYKRLEIAADNRSKWNNIPLWALLRETVNEKSRDRLSSPQMSGDTLRAMLTGGRYPATLYQQTMLRIRAEREITRGRAAIIKAYLTRNTDNENYKEALTVVLNEKTSYQPYVLGRIFSVLEAIQEKASSVTTIKDKFFTSACSTPAVVFPMILNLADKHLRKLDNGTRTYFEKQLRALTSLVSESYPPHHNLNDQGIFQLGYYHQTQKRYEKKGKIDSIENTAEMMEDK